MKQFLRSNILFILGVLFIALVIKCVPLFRFGVFAFGHDFGFYRRYVVQPLVSFPNTSVPGLDHTIFLPRIFLDIVRVILRTPDATLIIGYLMLSLVSIVSVWYFAKLYLSTKKALYAVVLYVVSGVGFVLYTSFFFKEMLALPLFLGALISFEKKRYGLAALLGVLVILTQQTTSIILICIIALGFVFRTIIERTISFKYIISGTGIFATYLFLHPHIAQKIASPPVGIFLSQSEYIVLSIPILILTVLGIRQVVITLKKQALLGASLTVVLLFVVFQLPFYNRIYAFLDLFLIIPAAFGVEYILSVITSKYKRLLPALISALVVVAAIPLIYLEFTLTPLVDTSTQKELTTLLSLPPNSSIITSPILLPWVQGWSLAKVYAPGNLKEPHSTEDWSRYWVHQDIQFEQKFLSTFPWPLYLFIDKKEMEYYPMCRKMLSQNLFLLGTCH